MAPVPDRSSLYELLFLNGQDPLHPAVVTPGSQPLSFDNLREQITTTVRCLNSLGFRCTDRIAIATPDIPETGVLLLSVMHGFTAAPLNPRYTADEYLRYFRQIRVNALVVQEHENPAARAAAARLNLPVIDLIPGMDRAGSYSLRTGRSQDRVPAYSSASDTAILLQTSGTTSTPKIVPLTHAHISRVARRSCATFGFTSADRCLHLAPYYHTMGIFGNFIAPLSAGGTVICPRNFIPRDIRLFLNDFSPTFYSAGPALHRAILRELKKIPPQELPRPSLRFIRSASASLSDKLRDELEQVLGVPLIETYGMSEVGGAITTNLPPARLGSVGRPVIDELAILDRTGRVLRPREEGEIAVRGPCVFTGYDDNPGENAALFSDGWFRTGDTGFLDEEGYLFLTGRKKELINKGGEKISPAEIDAVLVSCPGILDAMSFRLPDAALGEEIGAVVVPGTIRPSEQEIREYLVDHLSPQKIPSRIVFSESVPRTPNGKPLRYIATERYS